MKKSVKILSIFFVLLVGGSSKSYAATSNMDNICSKAAGYWKGLFVLKDEITCAKNNGCAHYIKANITDLGNNAYQVHLEPDLTGAGGAVPLNCNNGKMTSPNLPEGTIIYMNCSANNECTLNYESPFIFAYLHKAE